jgi:hypothetical protein
MMQQPHLQPQGLLEPLGGRCRACPSRDPSIILLHLRWRRRRKQSVEILHSVPEDMPQERTIEDIVELLDLVELVDMRVYAAEGRRKDSSVAEDHDQSGDIELNFMERHTAEVLENRFRLKVENEEAVYSADIGAIYALQEPVVPLPALVAEFAERVGFMAVFPYLRESISSSASRLGLPIPVLGIVRPGDFQITQPE